MIVTEARPIFENVTYVIAAIDQECCTFLSGVEHGLVNVKLEFADRALRETNKKLTEERLIAWLTAKKLDGYGWHVDWELSYPGIRRKKCDLVIQFTDTSRLWLEMKLAWKAWFNCEGEPVYKNRCYLPYLQGTSHTHSFRQDFEKLSTAQFPEQDSRAVCLIGFDLARAPMDEEVAAVVQDVQGEGGYWEAVTERHWPDRRCRDFRINVWSWLYFPQAMQAPACAQVESPRV